MQLDEARADHDQAATQATQHHGDLRQRAEAFTKQQNNIDRTLMIVTQSDSTEEAVARFEDVMSSYQRLEVATSYIALATEVETLRLVI